jgi:2-dehydropantoate 2-reductase
MRFVVFGVGAIGGMLGGKLARAGYDVVGIARGKHLEALQKNGLTIETATGDEVAKFPCVADASEIKFTDDDVIIISVKTQDFMAACEKLRDAGVHQQPIVCAQNGVEAERIALRKFPNVYGMCVRLPTNFEKPGIIRSWGHPHPGNLDIGRFPKGKDAVCDAIAAALIKAGYLAEAHPDVMVPKYDKLLGNLSNALQAVFGRTPPATEYFPILKKEGEAVYKAAGIDTFDPTMVGRPPKAMTEPPVKGQTRPGTSSWQSLVRGTGTMESDYLNGEIILLGRLHGVPTPANDFFCRLAQKMATSGAQPGSADPAAVAAEFKKAMEEAEKSAGKTRLSAAE